MKHIKHIFLAFLLFTVNYSLIANDFHKHFEKRLIENGISESDVKLSKAQTVFICTGTYAYAYHSSSNCPGLNNCSGQINYTDEYNAVKSLGRRACCRCWSNVSGNCKDDNPSYGSGGGGDNSDAYAYLALAIVATSAIILSNDFYIYPTYSFYKGTNIYDGKPLKNGTGWTFGFRKKFKNSALEYGASLIKYETTYKYNYGYDYGYTDTYNENRWGGHLNYVHQVFYNRTPMWLKAYLGPSVNRVYEFGYGGIVGTEIRIFDRLKFDVRYEMTTQTNQIQAGLIFTYQKKYFWTN